MKLAINSIERSVDFSTESFSHECEIVTIIKSMSMSMSSYGTVRAVR